MPRVTPCEIGAMTLELIFALTLLLLSALPLLALKAQSLRLYSNYVEFYRATNQCEHYGLQDDVLVLLCSENSESHLLFLEPDWGDQ